MTTRTWLGGGTNNIFAASDWSPTGLPAAGDTLVMNNGTANIYGGNLAGITFLFSSISHGSSSAVLNVFDGASVTLTEGGGTEASDKATVNVYGDDTVNILVPYGFKVGVSSTVNLAPNAALTGSFQLDGSVQGTAVLTIDGGKGSSFANTESSVTDCVAKIDASVIGTGSFELIQGSIEFGGSVSAGQTVSISERLPTFCTIDAPSTFGATIDWLLQVGNAPSQIDLLGITADSYSFNRGLLKLFSNDRIVDTLHLNATPGAFAVLRTSAGIELAAGAGASGSILPVHT